MNTLAPITWLIAQITGLVATNTVSIASFLSSTLAPIFSAGFGIYVLLTTLNLLRGGSQSSAPDLAIKLISAALVISIAFGVGIYESDIMPIVTDTGGDLANAVSGGTSTAGSLDTLAISYLNIIQAGYVAVESEPTNSFGIPPLGDWLLWFIKTVITIIGLVPFLIAATLALIVAAVGSQIMAAVAPLFIGFLIFPATRQYFSSWVNTTFSYALIPLLIAVVASISVGISTTMLGTAGSTSATGAPFTNVLFAAIGNLVLLFLVKQVASIASSLSAGGINAGMVQGGLGSTAKGIASFGARGINGARDGAGRSLATGAYGAGRWGAGKAADAYAAIRGGNSMRKGG